MSDVGSTDERNSAIRQREDGGAQRHRLKKEKGGEAVMLLLRPRPHTHGYLGYLWSGAVGRRGGTLVLAPPCGGQPRTLILHHSPHGLLPPDLLTPRAGVMSAGIHADLGGGAQRVAVRVSAAVSARPQGLSVGHSLAGHTCHIDLRNGHAPHCCSTVYTHLLGL